MQLIGVKYKDLLDRYFILQLLYTKIQGGSNTRSQLLLLIQMVGRVSSTILLFLSNRSSDISLHILEPL